jgi:DsbC/DsbD-like thiol-disulfide interchange protein
MMRSFVTQMIAAAVACSFLQAEEKATIGVDLKLLSDVTAITPGKSFTVVLSVHHHDGVHTYWKNPGIVGVPISLEWQLPEGFTAGDIQWPVPELVDMAGHSAHGYTRDILLLVDITPPMSLAKGLIELRANSRWMACGEGCHPGEKSFALSLPVTESDSAVAASSAAGAIAEARAALPRPLSGWTVTLETPADAEEIRAKFIFTGGPPPDLGNVYFYSGDGQISSSPAQKIERLDDGFRLIAERAEYGPKGQKTLLGVLVAEKPFSLTLGTAATVEATYP